MFVNTRCPKKKCELLLLLQVVTHTFFWDTLYDCIGNNKLCVYYLEIQIRNQQHNFRKKSNT